MMIAYLLLLHFVADFVLQSREMGQKKSVELSWLLKHMGIQFAVFFMGLYILFLFTGNYPACFPSLLFVVMNTIAHGLIDWDIWKIYKLSANNRIVAHLKGLGVYGSDPENSIAYKIAYEKQVKEWKYWEDHTFYTTIGFDQLLHTVTLVLLASLFL